MWQNVTGCNPRKCAICCISSGKLIKQDIRKVDKYKKNLINYFPIKTVVEQLNTFIELKDK